MGHVLRRFPESGRAAMWGGGLAILAVAAATLVQSSSPWPTRSSLVASPGRGAAVAARSFVPNRGQLPASVQYAASGSEYAFAFERDRVRIALASGTTTMQVALRFVGAQAGATE